MAQFLNFKRNLTSTLSRFQNKTTFDLEQTPNKLQNGLTRVHHLPKFVPSLLSWTPSWNITSPPRQTIGCQKRDIEVAPAGLWNRPGCLQTRSAQMFLLVFSCLKEGVVNRRSKWHFYGMGFGNWGGGSERNWRNGKVEIFWIGGWKKERKLEKVFLI